MRACKTCLIAKPITEFRYNNHGRNRRWECHDCEVLCKRQHYRQNSIRLAAQSKEYKRRLRNENKCVRCSKPKIGQTAECSSCAEKSRIEGRYKRLQLKKQALAHYGGEQCSCNGCNASAIEWLTIDHVNGFGEKHREAIGTRSGFLFYRWLKKNNYPPGFRVLCFNCNCARGAYGYCPHEKV
jgi:hypothetical protein